ncbi:methylated-DNA--[protein]-cysteine S-methyltransferase [Methanolobus sediminis]|uniref:methylated-DNA--[protein]-cysteine S-methyltransferase n=1 Tax=Methanolobus sediminis TaxID=3072978 RepID=A0AA51UN13_9EURY|nr:methylated-DNA--[protein]-cysteine S-methyltransferase [Methanolobus sediminis]WMW26267.1 methylated-DNA--[protein]-cysteine S-methyltransferase [Methanolobus sediminis]
MNDMTIFQAILRYFGGEIIDFSDCEVDLSGLTQFQREVLEEVRKIPYGETITYQELASRVGRNGAARAVGSAVAKNPYPIIIPCHRVVASSGIGGFCGETCGEKVELKRKMLEMEANCKRK